MATIRNGKVTVSFADAMPNQTVLYDSIGRSAGQNANSGFNPFSFIGDKVKSAENAFGTTGSAVVDTVRSGLNLFGNTKGTGLENAATQDLLSRNKRNLDDVYKAHGFQGRNDFINQLSEAERSGNQEEANRLMALEQSFTNELQGVANSNADSAKAKQQAYNDYRKNSYIGQKVNQNNAKFAGSALNTLSTMADVAGMATGAPFLMIPNRVLGNTLQGAIGGVANELERNGGNIDVTRLFDKGIQTSNWDNFDWNNAAQGALIGGASGLATGMLNQAWTPRQVSGTGGARDLLTKVANSQIGRGAVSGALGGAVGGGLSAGLNGGDWKQGALQGAGQGALSGATSSAIMQGATTLGGKALNKINPKLAQRVAQNKDAYKNWRESGKTTMERFNNTATSGDSAVGNWLMGQKSGLLGRAGEHMRNGGLSIQPSSRSGYDNLVNNLSAYTNRDDLVADIMATGLTPTEFLDALTDNNFHTERVLAEAIMTGNQDYINRAQQILAQHEKDGKMTDANYAARRQLIDDMNNQTSSTTQGTQTTGTTGSNQSVRDWYMKNYADDELGGRINPNLTFDDLKNNVGSVYDKIGFTDSVIRERLFNQLVNQYGGTYDDYYNQWLNGGNGGNRQVQVETVPEYVDPEIQALMNKSQGATPEYIDVEPESQAPRTKAQANVLAKAQNEANGWFDDLTKEPYSWAEGENTFRGLSPQARKYILQHPEEYGLNTSALKAYSMVDNELNKHGYYTPFSDESKRIAENIERTFGGADGANLLNNWDKLEEYTLKQDPEVRGAILQRLQRDMPSDAQYLVNDLMDKSNEADMAWLSGELQNKSREDLRQYLANNNPNQDSEDFTTYERALVKNLQSRSEKPSEGYGDLFDEMFDLQRQNKQSYLYPDQAARFGEAGGAPVARIVADNMLPGLTERMSAIEGRTLEPHIAESIAPDGTRYRSVMFSKPSDPTDMLWVDVDTGEVTNRDGNVVGKWNTVFSNGRTNAKDYTDYQNTYKKTATQTQTTGTVKDLLESAGIKPDTTEIRPETATQQQAEQFAKEVLDWETRTQGKEYTMKGAKGQDFSPNGLRALEIARAYLERPQELVQAFANASNNLRSLPDNLNIDPNIDPQEAINELIAIQNKYGLNLNSKPQPNIVRQNLIQAHKYADLAKGNRVDTIDAEDMRAARAFGISDNDLDILSNNRSDFWDGVVTILEAENYDNPVLARNYLSRIDQLDRLHQTETNEATARRYVDEMNELNSKLNNMAKSRFDDLPTRTNGEQSGNNIPEQYKVDSKTIRNAAQNMDEATKARIAKWEAEDQANLLTSKPKFAVMKSRLENLVGSEIKFENALMLLNKNSGTPKSFTFTDSDGNRYSYDVNKGVQKINGYEDFTPVVSQSEQKAMNDKRWNDRNLTGAKIKTILKQAGIDTTGLSISRRGNAYSHSWNISGDGSKIDLPTVERIVRNKLESYDRDERTGEILSGGNTFVFSDDTGDYDSLKGKDFKDYTAKDWLKQAGKRLNEDLNDKAMPGMGRLRIVDNEDNSPETEIYRKITSMQPQGGGTGGDGTDDFVSGYGESALATGAKNKSNLLTRVGKAMQGAQAYTNREENRKGGITDPGEVINNVRKRTGISNLETQAQLANELTGTGEAVLDKIQRTALGATEDGSTRTVDLTDLMPQIDKELEKVSSSSMSAYDKQKFREDLLSDLTNHAIDTIEKANVQRKNAANHFQKWQLNPTQGNERDKGMLYSRVADLIDDATYNAIPKENIDDMFDSAQMELQRRAGVASKHGVKQVAKAYTKLANEIAKTPHTIENFRHFKKDFVDVRYLQSRSGRASSAWNNNPALTGMAVGTALMSANPLVGIGKAMLLKSAAPAVGQMATSAGAKVGGYLADAGDALAQYASTPVAPISQNQLSLYNALGREAGNEANKQINPNLTTTSDSSDTVLASADTTTQPVALLASTGNAYPESATATTTASESPTSVYDTLTGTTSTPSYSYTNTQSTGNSWLDTLKGAMDKAAQAGDANAFATLYQMYANASSSSSSNKDMSNPANWSTSDRSKLLDAQNGLSQLDTLEQAYNQATGGSGNAIVGNIRNTINDWTGGNFDATASNYNALAQSVGLGIVKNLVNMGTNNADVEIYKKYIPALTDTAEQARIKLETLRQIYQNQINNLYSVNGM